VVARSSRLKPYAWPQGDPGITTFDAVAALVDKSLLRQDADEDGEPRFGMLETVREFALEQLAASGEEPGTRAAHADVAIAIAEAHEPALTGAGQPQALQQLGREHDNLRTAFDWTIRARDSVRALRLGAALCRFWIIRGFHTEGRQRLRAALDLPSTHDDEAVRARVLSGLSVLAYEQGDLPEATRHLEEAAALLPRDRR
jgi:predicted ATPase